MPVFRVYYKYHGDGHSDVEAESEKEAEDTAPIIPDVIYPDSEWYINRVEQEEE